METLFEEMKRFVGFTQEDSRLLAGFRPLAAAHYHWIVECFYDRILAHPRARSIFSGPDQVLRLKATLQVWADQLLAGPHDERYFALRSRIGRTHVRVGLPQAYMFTAMNVIRESFRQVAMKELSHDAERMARVTSSLHKILDLDLAIMMETFREDYIARLHRSEQQAALKRLASIGEVAATVAHEVRNPLAGISGALEVLRDDLPFDSPRREVIAEAFSQIQRLDSRVRDLLLYARKVDLRPEPVEIAELIRSTLALLSEEPLLRDVSAHVEVPVDLAVYSMDRGLIQESLVNLILNAASAMGGRGDLYLEAKRSDEGSLCLIVEDTGPGVPPGRVEEIFKPFFTTRPEGTGLGLSISRKTLEAHGGSLNYEKGRRGGARFIACLPLEMAAVGAAVEEP